MTGVYEVMSSLEEVNGNNHSQSLLVQERDGRWHFKTRGRRFSSTWHLSKFWNFLTMDIVDTRKSLQDFQKESSEQGGVWHETFVKVFCWTVSCAKVFHTEHTFLSFVWNCRHTQHSQCNNLHTLCFSYLFHSEGLHLLPCNAQFLPSTIGQLYYIWKCRLKTEIRQNNKI